jgi:hypothetical protein
MNTTIGSSYGTNRKTAIMVGVLFIVGTVAGVLSVAFTGPILADPHFLMKVSANGNQIIIGALFVLMMGFALAMIPVMMFPILKKYNEALALGYVVFRGGLETVTYIVTAISWLLLLPLSQEYAKAGVPDPSAFQAFGISLREVAHLPMTVFVFGLGALLFYHLLYRSNLIPRWIAVWGFIAILLHLATGLLIVFGLQNESSVMNTVMNLPIFLQEMVMAVWLIAKGFNPSA